MNGRRGCLQVSTTGEKPRRDRSLRRVWSLGNDQPTPVGWGCLLKTASPFAPTSCPRPPHAPVSPRPHRASPKTAPPFAPKLCRAPRPLGFSPPGSARHPKQLDPLRPNCARPAPPVFSAHLDRKSTRLNSSHLG